MAGVFPQSYARTTTGRDISAPTARVALAQKETPHLFRTYPCEPFFSGHDDIAVNGESIEHRIAETKDWLSRMSKEVRNARRKQKKEEKAASLLCSALRASSVLLTERTSPGTNSRRFRFALLSFLDGTPFLTPKDLCRYNTAVAELLSDDHLELLRRHVFDYDEVAFADLLYADGVALSLRSDTALTDVVPECVRNFNAAAREALRRLVASPGRLADATMRATQLVSVVVNDVKATA